MIEIQLTEMLKKKKLSTNDFCKLSGLSQSYLSLVYAGKRGLSMKSLAKICKVLKCQPGQLLKYKEEVN